MLPKQTALPMVTAPMAMPPVVPPPSPMPAPVTPVPMTPAPMPSPVPTMAPMDLLRLEMIDVVLCNDCGFYTLAAAERESRLRQDE
jgi:hypothetical protein